jgi:hypothetical protein
MSRPSPSAPRIFISIVAYRDPLLAFTLARAKGLASQADRLHFCVVDQEEQQTPWLTPQQLAPARLSYLRIDFRHARGPCWARALAMSYYDDEEWFFQIDSHMDFEPGWDERLIAHAERLRTGCENFVISVYPAGFEIVGDQVLHPEPMAGVSAMRVRDLDDFLPEAPILYFTAQHIPNATCVEGFALGAGCLFAPGHYVQRFPYDPCYYFHGEEQSLALRLYTHGWSIFHVDNMPIYHLYNTPKEEPAPVRLLHWNPSQERQQAQSWKTLNARGFHRLRCLIEGADLGVFGLGRQRSIADFAAFSGIDYRAHRVEPRALAPTD